MSTGGSLVPKFEQAVASYVGMPGAVACNSGTSGLHLAMMMAGVGRGDEVLVPTLTFIAAVNPVRYAGAEPIFIGCGDSRTSAPPWWRNIWRKMPSCAATNASTSARARIRTMVVVHVFGNIAAMPELMRVAKKYGLR